LPATTRRISLLRRMAFLLYPAFQAGAFLAGVLPPRFGYWLCHRGGDLAFTLLRDRRRITAENFARVSGLPPTDGDVLKMVRSSFRNYGEYLYETVRLSHQTKQQVLDRVNVHGKENLLRALERGKGVIFVSAHLGNMDLGGIALASLTCPMTVAGTALEPRQVMDRLVAQRSAKGLKMTVYASAARDVLVALKRNETVGFLVDLGVRWTGNGIVVVDFFGAPAPFPAGVAQLALRTGAPIVPGYAVIRPDHGVDAFALPHIEVVSTGDRCADVKACMQQVAHALEGVVRGNLDQWYMYRPMWSRPGDSECADTPASGEGGNSKQC
jgi:Kdo2-lipid IVA lauroyltransferase/acyltransferase